ncbi:hypothetical protein T552_00672 [Pneumocystis carinii B80]|uniref:Exoribonuclease phosphorolytic domain-containing protein n=1 Tax=Pneumocystis carinii (strain B80) TaxID=1408658 RepID=A0A0W4ZP99_PNEC8|nr:hypothetical protein T552_00672 [Pneumocystis carinii B80]KTW30194.1 hypothetical protein T552_00672 [Pneumocystis carinii B80]
MKKIFFETSLLERVDGSCVYREGLNKVVCSIVGPSEIKTRDDALGEAVLDVIIRFNIGLYGAKERQIEQTIHKIVSATIIRAMYPHTLIQVIIQVISCDKSENTASLLATMLNATNIALIDSGISLLYTFSAICFAVIIKNKEISIIADPAQKILNECMSTHVICYSFPDEKLLSCESIGHFTENEFFEILLKAKSSCKNIYYEIKTRMTEKMIQENRK